MPLDYLPGTFFGPSNLVDLVRHRASHQPDEIAFSYLVDGESQQVHLTNQELDRQARAIGAWLETRGMAGRRALLLYPAGLEFIAAFFGCLYAGVVAVPVYPPRRNRSLRRIRAIAEDAEAEVALTTGAVLERVGRLIEETPGLEELTWLATCRVPEGMDARWQMPDVHGDTLAFLQYTSGSTGAPKGVMLNHANLLHNSALIACAFEHTRSGIGVFWLPGYHDMGLIGGILQPLYMGRPNILMSPMSFLQRPYRWLSAITRYGSMTSGGITSGGPNFAYDLCVEKTTPEQRETLDLSKWAVAFNGAEPVRAETLDRFCEAFEPCGFRPEAFYPCFGLAEATLIVSGGYARQAPVVRNFEARMLAAGQVADGQPDEEGVRALVGCGNTMPDQQIVIVDPRRMTRSPADEVGEIWVRGPSVAQGYWRKPEATAATFGAFLKDTSEGPFLRTGDLGFIQDGELYVTGRLKDLIIIHGLNHYPQDIELTVQQSHSRLRPDCGAAFTVTAEGRQRLVVVHEIERRREGDLAPVFDAVRHAVAAEHELAVDSIVLVRAGSIPKTSSGKIQRRACRQGYLEGSLAVVGRWDAPQPEMRAVLPAADDLREEALPAGVGSTQEAAAAESGNGATARTNRTAQLVLEQVRRIARDRASGLTLDSPIVEIGLDSIERLEILASLEERFGGRFPEEILPELETCRQVVEAVERHLGTERRAKPVRPTDGEIPAEHYRLECFPEYVKLKQSLDILASSGLGNPYFTVHQGVANDRTTIDGREVINFSSCNYLGMSGDPVVVRAAQHAAEQYGTSVSASRLVSGERPLHRELEQAIAGFLGTEDAIVLVGGHAANETVIGHLLGPGDLVLHDALAQNSALQGSMLSGARRRTFPHNDPQAADELLAESRHEYRRVLIVIEGVYSMDGEIPDLPRFIDVKRRHKALLMIDEAHSIGTLGAHGRGIAEHFGVSPAHADLWMGTLSKSFGSSGGYIAGCREVVAYLKYTAPGFVYSVGISPPAAAAALASVRLLVAEPERTGRLQQRARLFLCLAGEQGLDTGKSQDSPVVPVILGNSIHCLRLAAALGDRGIHVQPSLYPAVEESAARLRFFLTALHTREQIRHTIDAVVEELGKIDPKYLAGPGSGRPTPGQSAQPH